MFYFDYETIGNQTMERIWNIINSASPSDWWRENNYVEWRISLPYDIFDHEKISGALIKNFVEPRRLYIQRLEPKTSYNWHADYARFTSITMGLNVFEKSYTVFSEPREYNHFCNLDVLYYRPNHAYLIDGTKLHTGFNLSDETRYLLSVSLSKPATLQSTIKFIRENL